MKLLRPCLIASALLPPLASALSNADLASVFGAQATGLTGSSVTLPQFTLSVVLNDTFALFSLNATSSKPYQVGWMGTGIGSAMKDADFTIGWPNPAQANGAVASSPWTMSHRATVGGEAQPVVASTSLSSSTSALFTFLPDLSTSDPNSPFTVISYLRPLTFPSDLSTSTFKPLQRAQTQFIYASSTVQPGNTAENAVLTQHDQAHATTMLDLSAPITLASTPSGTGTSSAPGSTGSSAPLTSTTAGRTKRDMYLIAHAVLGSLALIFFTPAAILIARYFRGYTWFPAHAALNILGATLIVACFAIGYDFSNLRPHFSDSHTRVGLAILILVLLQVILGSAAHAIPAPKHDSITYPRFPTLKGKSPVRLLHIVFGLAISILGFAQVRLGFTEYHTKSDGLEMVPRGVVILFWVIAGVVAAAYIGGWVIEGVGKRRSRPYGDGGAEKVGSNEETG